MTFGDCILTLTDVYLVYPCRASPLMHLAIHHLVHLNQGHKVDALETTISRALRSTAYLTRGLFHLALVSYCTQDPNTNNSVFRITTLQVPMLAAMFPAHPHPQPRESLTSPSPPSWQGSGPAPQHTCTQSLPKSLALKCGCMRLS